jgi:hypothetical protein
VIEGFDNIPFRLIQKPVCVILQIEEARAVKKQYAFVE